jgi:hypothetical protein
VQQRQCRHPTQARAARPPQQRRPPLPLGGAAQTNSACGTRGPGRRPRWAHPRWRAGVRSPTRAGKPTRRR